MSSVTFPSSASSEIPTFLNIQNPATEQLSLKTFNNLVSDYQGINQSIPFSISATLGSQTIQNFPILDPVLMTSMTSVSGDQEIIKIQ